MTYLRPMTAEELSAYLERSIPEYARDNVRAGRWSEERSLELSRLEHAQLLPNGVDTPDHYLRMVLDREGGVSVGEVWYALQRQGGQPQVFVYWIGIHPEHRRHGYASDALRAVEAEARALGAGRLSLHVFAENRSAQAMYARLGYAPTNLILSKVLTA